MSDLLYLTLMLGAVGVLVVIIVPAVFWRKCPACGARNVLDRAACRACGNTLTSD